jgi:hypothetical protein
LERKEKGWSCSTGKSHARLSYMEKSMILHFKALAFVLENKFPIQYD